MPRIRIRHTKNRLLQYTGTLDIQKLWERTLRRALLPIEYSQGFHPQPKIQLACPLPLGMTSRAEYVDFWLEQYYEPVSLQKRIEQVNHPGVDILDLAYAAEKEPSLQSRLHATITSVTLPAGMDLDGLKTRLAEVLASPSILLERRGKQYDLRPLIEDCALIEDSTLIEDSALEQPASDDTALLRMTLSARSGATGRPEEVLRVLRIDQNEVHMQREEIIFTPLPS